MTMQKYVAVARSACMAHHEIAEIYSDDALHAWSYDERICSGNPLCMHVFARTCETRGGTRGGETREKHVRARDRIREKRGGTCYIQVPLSYLVTNLNYFSTCASNYLSTTATTIYREYVRYLTCPL